MFIPFSIRNRIINVFYYLPERNSEEITLLFQMMIKVVLKLRHVKRKFILCHPYFTLSMLVLNTWFIILMILAWWRIVNNEEAGLPECSAFSLSNFIFHPAKTFAKKHPRSVKWHKKIGLGNWEWTLAFENSPNLPRKIRNWASIIIKITLEIPKLLNLTFAKLNGRKHPTERVKSC